MGWSVGWVGVGIKYSELRAVCLRACATTLSAAYVTPPHTLSGWTVQLQLEVGHLTESASSPLALNVNACPTHYSPGNALLLPPLQQP